MNTMSYHEKSYNTINWWTMPPISVKADVGKAKFLLKVATCHRKDCPTSRFLSWSGVFHLDADLVGAVVNVKYGHNALDLQIPGPVKKEKFSRSAQP